MDTFILQHTELTERLVQDFLKWMASNTDCTYPELTQYWIQYNNPESDPIILNQCKYILKKGKRIGEECKVRIKSSAQYCSKHLNIKKIPEQIFDIDLNKVEDEQKYEDIESDHEEDEIIEEDKINESNVLNVLSEKNGNEVDDIDDIEEIDDTEDVDVEEDVEEDECSE